MTNEEKMEMLALMQEAVQPINNRLDKLEQDISGMKQDVSNVQQDISSMKQGIADVKQVQLNSVVSDNDIQKKLGVLLDGMKGVQDRFDRQDRLENKVEDLGNRVSALEYAMKK